MVKSRKSQGMPINVIIIAALALVVLIVLLAVFTGRIKIFSENLQSCAAKQGQCEAGLSCSSGKALVTNTNCPETEADKQSNPKKILCCVQVFSQ